MTGQTVREFYSAIQYVQLFRFDDVYTGMLAHFLGIIVTHDDNFSFYYPPNEEEALGKFWRTTVASHSKQPWLSYDEVLAANGTTTTTATAGMQETLSKSYANSHRQEGWRDSSRRTRRKRGREA